MTAHKHSAGSLLLTRLRFVCGIVMARTFLIHHSNELATKKLPIHWDFHWDFITHLKEKLVIQRLSFLDGYAYSHCSIFQRSVTHMRQTWLCPQ